MDTNSETNTIPSGWKGGFAQSNPDFAYPNPNLSSLLILDNMANIDKLTRQQPVKWPEFSWLTVPDVEGSRCFQMFAPYISRLGYTNEGRVYSIICPQQGACSPSLGCMNVEVTVTGQRGWVDETAKDFAAGMTVEGKIWFSPSAHQKPFVKLLWKLFEDNKLPFPSSKDKAIRVSTHKSGDINEPIFPLLSGETKQFKSPDFARHETDAWDVGNIQVQIGAIHKTGNNMVDDFNDLIMDVFNLASGNMLKKENILTWNIWFTPPELVDREEWKNHAEKWRKSIEADHGSPDGEGTNPRYFNGTYFKALDKKQMEEEVEKILSYLKTHLGSV